MSLAYYPRYPRDLLEACIGLPFEVKCAFGLVLDLIYMRDGRLPDDARYIAGQLGCSVRKWKSIREALIAADKLIVKDGIISTLRSDNLTETSRKYQDKQAENAGKPRKNKDLRQPKPSQSESEPDTTVANAPVVARLKAEQRARPSKRCPASWSPSPADLDAVEGMTPGEIERELAKFRDHTFATARTDWPATFRNWLRRARETPEKRHVPDKHAARQDNLRAAWTGSEHAVEILAARRAL